MTTSLAAAIDSLYTAFARVPRPASIDHCECCFTADEESAVLAAVPLRQLPIDALQPYAADVMLTVGAVADFRYFLPRLLDIACRTGFAWPDLESMVARLRFAGWSRWQDEERNAAAGRLAALWAHTLAGDPDDEDVDTVLCAIGNAEDDLEPYLREWGAALARPEARPAAVAQLRSLLERGCSDGRLTNAFWQDRDRQAEQVLAWLSRTDPG